MRRTPGSGNDLWPCYFCNASPGTEHMSCSEGRWGRLDCCLPPPPPPILPWVATVLCSRSLLCPQQLASIVTLFGLEPVRGMHRLPYFKKILLTCNHVAADVGGLATLLPPLHRLIFSVKKRGTFFDHSFAACLIKSEDCLKFCGTSLPGRCLLVLFLL